jgi:hypothetical protein
LANEAQFIVPGIDIDRSLEYLIGPAELWSNVKVFNQARARKTEMLWRAWLNYRGSARPLRSHGLFSCGRVACLNSDFKL